MNKTDEIAELRREVGDLRRNVANLRRQVDQFADVVRPLRHIELHPTNGGGEAVFAKDNVILPEIRVS